MNPQQFFKTLLTEAEKAGFQESEVYFAGGDSFKVKVHQGEISHYENSIETGISFRGLFHGKMGYAYTERMDEAAVAYLIKEAAENAAIIEDEDETFIYAGDKNYPEINSFNPYLQEVTAEEKIKGAMEIEVSALQTDSRIASLNYCMAATGKQEVSIQNSKGLNLSHKMNYGLAFASAIAKENEDIKTGSEYWIGNDWHRFDPAQIGREAASEAIGNLGAQPVPTGTYNIVLKNEAASDLLAVYCNVFYGESVQKGFSLLNGKLGAKIAADIVTIRDDGLLENYLGSAPFDSEGVAVQNKGIIENGVLKMYLHNLKTAKKDGVPSTGNGFKASYKSSVHTACTNFYIQNGEANLSSLLESLQNGLLICELAGLHTVNTISGDFSISASGFKVEGGKSAYPVEQITIAGNFYQLLKDIKEIGNDLRFTPPGADGSIGSPSLFIQNISVSGK